MSPEPVCTASGVEKETKWQTEVRTAGCVEDLCGGRRVAGRVGRILERRQRAAGPAVTPIRKNCLHPSLVFSFFFSPPDWSSGYSPHHLAAVAPVCQAFGGNFMILFFKFWFLKEYSAKNQSLGRLISFLRKFTIEGRFIRTIRQFTLKKCRFMMQVPDIYHQGAAGHNYGQAKISCNKKFWVKHWILDMKWLKCGKLKHEWVKRRHLSRTKRIIYHSVCVGRRRAQVKFLNRSLFRSDLISKQLWIGPAKEKGSEGSIE